MMPDLLFGAIDIVVLIVVVIAIARRRISIVIAALIALSLIFAPHALAALIYTETKSVNPQIVYETLPFLHTLHNGIGAIPILALIYAGLSNVRRASVTSAQTIGYGLGALLVAFAGIASGGGIRADFVAILAFFIVGWAMFMALSSERQNTDLDIASLRYFVWIAAISVVVSVLEIALAKVRAATIYALPEPDSSILIAYRASGLFNNPNWQGNWCALLMLCCAWCIQQNRDRAWGYLGLLLSVLGIYLSGSRGALASAGLVLFVYLLLSLRHHFKRSVLTGLVVAAAAIVTDLFGIIAYALLPDWQFAQNMFALHYRWFSQTIGLILAAIGTIFNVTLIDAAAPAAESVSGRLSAGEGSDNGLAPLFMLGGVGPYALVPLLVVIALALFSIWRSPWRRSLFPLAVAALAFAVLLPLQLQAFSVFPIWIFEGAVLAAILAMGFRAYGQAGHTTPLSPTQTAR